MISADDTSKALQDWALTELKQVGVRNFELSKFLFGISAGSFAILPFFDAQISIFVFPHALTLSALGGSAVVAILMASPAVFEVGEKTDLSKEHTDYANHLSRLKYLWMCFWLVGILTALVTFGGAEQGDIAVNG